MDLLAWVTGLLLVAGFGTAGFAKVKGRQAMVDLAAHLQVDWSQFRMIGTAELTGAVGVLLGLIASGLTWVGVAAAVGLALVGLGAVTLHGRADDQLKQIAPPAVLAIVAVVHLVAAASR